MKKFLFVLQLSLVSLFGFSQTVTLQCPGSVEVGIPASFTANFDASLSDITIDRFEWVVNNIAPGLGGPSGIIGNINGSTSFFSTYTAITSDNSNTITIKWGDVATTCSDKIKVTVHFKQKNKEGNIENNSLFKECSIKIFCVANPIISGPSSVQNCCQKVLTYCDNNSLGNQDTWFWIVSGGTIVTGQGTKCISVISNKIEELIVTSTARRKTGLPAYTRSSTIKTIRDTPQPPEITGPANICDGNQIQLCVEPLCGMSGVNWIVPNNFTLISGQGSFCAIIQPNMQPNGSVGTVTAQMQFQDSCISLSSSKTIKVFTTEIPPCPIGYPTIIFEEDYDPCDHDGTTFTFNFVTNKPYLNGVTTINPPVVVDVPHHKVNDRISITVCNKNLCSGQSCCKNYLMFFPAPCFTDDGIKSLVSNDDDVILTDKELFDSRYSLIDSKNKSLVIFPNPAQNNIRIESPIILNGNITIFDLFGNTIIQKKLENTIGINLDLTNISENGIYFLVIGSNEEFLTHKLIINR